MMSKFKKIQKALSVSLCAVGLNFVSGEIPKVEAVYRSHSDTGTQIFDYIENRRRERRANALTDEQKKLLRDIKTAEENLPHELKEGDPIPAAFEGDDMVYNAATGEFKATGHVDVIQLEGYRFQTEEATGNIKTQDVEVEDKAHMLQLKTGAPRVTLDGYHTVYNYGTKTGTMENAKGKAGEYYISGKRFEFYPDHVVIHDATQTKCSAKNPDYHLSAERMEIWPDQIIRMYNIRFWIRDKVVGRKDYDESLVNSSEPYFPTFGYDSDDGVYVEDTFEFPFGSNFKGLINANINSKYGFRSSGEIVYNNRQWDSRVMYGYYRDSDGHWIKKLPSWRTTFSGHLPNAPLRYSLRYEVGHWKAEGATSNHQEAIVRLNHDPIVFGKNFYLFLGVGYKWTHDDSDQLGNKLSTRKGMLYNAILAREFDDRFAMFVGYRQSESDTGQSLFKFGLDDYARKFSTGISYRLTDKDRVVIGCSFNMETGRLADVDYYWYRDLHCSTAVFRWRQKRHKFEVHWQFTPW